MSVQAMKAGAVDFLTKPFRDQTLLDAVTASGAARLSQSGQASTAPFANWLRGMGAIRRNWSRTSRRKAAEYAVAA